MARRLAWHKRMLQCSRGARRVTQRCCSSSQASSPSFQEAVQQLQAFWSSRGALVAPPHNVEVGAGTMNPATFLRVLGPEPWWAVYTEPAVRPADSRYGDNPNRTQRHTQLQVVLQPEPENPQELYLHSLQALGVDASKHDVRFVEDDWESPVLGAWGLGWEVWLDGLEITQFTYFQQAGGLQCNPPAVEITYGLERILMALQRVQHFKDIVYSPTGQLYGDLFGQTELEFSRFNLDLADVADQRKRFEMFEAEAWRLCEAHAPLPAYDHLLKASHAFNVLDARGAVSVTERADLFQRMRNMARECARLWLKRRSELDFPLSQWEPKELPDLPEANVTGTEHEETLRDLVVEIGTEELPADDVNAGSAQLAEKLHSSLSANLLVPEHISYGGTPRRLWFIGHNVPARQPDRQELVRGPPVSKAYDEDGTPTKALEGFCRKNGVDASADVEILSDSRDIEHCYARVLYRGQPALFALQNCIVSCIEQISFKKTMRWNGDAAFSRPVRSLLAMYGDDLIPVQALGVQSGRRVQLLRASAEASAKISKAEEYKAVVESEGIVLDNRTRMHTICDAAKNAAASKGGAVPEWALEDLAEEVCNLVEAPLTLLGRFSDRFLELPREVLEVVMRNHQRYFPVASEGELLPYFIFTANGHPDPEITTEGHEAVLRARFEDASFFYKQDTEEKTLESTFRPMLDGINFEKNLGTMLAKVQRVEMLLPELAKLLPAVDDDVLSTAQQGARLHRADRATNLVQEFTELEGIMGRHYALREGVAQAVADVVLDAQKPRYADDQAAESLAGALVAVCDRIDSLTGLYAAVGGPTTSGDPFSMRRIAAGLIEITLAHHLPLDIREAVAMSSKLQPVHIDNNLQDVVVAFVVRRLEQRLADEGVTVECSRAVVNSQGDNLLHMYEAALELDDLFKNNKLGNALTAFARPIRLIRSKVPDADAKLDEQLLQSDAEKELFEASKQFEKRIHQHQSVNGSIGIKEFVQATDELLSKPVEHFFDEVFVMTDDESLRKNRLALLQHVASLSDGVVDFSKLPGF